MAAVAAVNTMLSSRPLMRPLSPTVCVTRLSSALAEARIGVFAVSTFNTDCILVRTADFDRAREALRRIGCEWRDEK